ncbi:hypothetical protein PR048_025161 [Dryococelus australis]|uniref:Reverse transcriptase/retrotransposon-derived protein RNase H-like domain-containing protein n=1 Tax=Dryococelus australis TaxID=614101 RepID=A0ABQ9GQI3_9NEOP|nr:hypothetical protein PR048_025161 [Dryococelus australis]
MSNETFSHTIMNLSAVSGHNTDCHNRMSNINLAVALVYQQALSVAFALTTMMEEANEANVRRRVWIPVNQADTVNHHVSTDIIKSSALDQVLSGGLVYDTTDLDEAYMQIPVDGETSRILTLFNAFTGLNGYLLNTRLRICKFCIFLVTDSWLAITNPTTDKTTTIINATSPLLFKDKATILEPLHRLLNSKSEWALTTKHRHTFHMVKHMLTSQALDHYNPDLPLVVTADALPAGVGAVLGTHHTKCSAWQNKRYLMPMHHKHCLPERECLQLDREELTFIFAVKFIPYLAFCQFTIITYHTTLLGIFSPDRLTPLHLSPQMLLWTLIQSSFDYELCQTR